MKHKDMPRQPFEGWDIEVTRYLRGGGKAQVDANKLPLVCHDDFQNFDQKLTTTFRILVGGKGTGKSTALIRKAVSLLDKERKLVPDHYPYYVGLQAVDVPLKEGDSGEYTASLEHSFWVKAWKVIFCVVFVIEIHMSTVREEGLSHVLKCKKDDPLVELFDRIGREYVRNRENRTTDVISPILGLLLKRNYSMEEFNDWFLHLLQPAMTCKEDEQYVIVVDQIDQAFAPYKTEAYARSIWVSAQTGLIDAASDIQETVAQGSFQVYAAIRSEAYRRYPPVGALNRSQASQFCLVLEYDDNQLSEIFELNVSLTDESRLAQPKDDNAIRRFLGVTRYPHPYVANIRESAMQWLKRHTFGSPRELVWHGRNIVKLNPALRKQREQIAPVVNGTGTLIYEDYIAELVPAWKEDVEDVFGELTHNVLSEEQVKQIDQSFSATKGYAPLTYLFNCGLLGYNLNSRQKFLSVSELGQNKDLPPSQFYVLHPCLNEKIEEHLSDDARRGYYSQGFLIGNGLECPKRLLRPVIVLTWDKDNQEGRVSLMPDDCGWNPSSRDVRGCAIDTLEVSPFTTNVAPILLFSILSAMSETMRKDPSVDDICDVVERLVDDAICPEALGNKNKRGAAPEYFRSELMYDEERPHPVRAVDELLKKAGLKERNWELHKGRGEKSVQRYGIVGVKPATIRRRF